MTSFQRLAEQTVCEAPAAALLASIIPTFGAGSAAVAAPATAGAAGAAAGTAAGAAAAPAIAGTGLTGGLSAATKAVAATTLGAGATAAAGELMKPKVKKPPVPDPATKKVEVDEFAKRRKNIQRRRSSQYSSLFSGQTGGGSQTLG